MHLLAVAHPPFWVECCCCSSEGIIIVQQSKPAFILDAASCSNHVTWPGHHLIFGSGQLSSTGQWPCRTHDLLRCTMKLCSALTSTLLVLWYCFQISYCKQPLQQLQMYPQLTKLVTAWGIVHIAFGEAEGTSIMYTSWLHASGQVPRGRLFNPTHGGWQHERPWGSWKAWVD